MTCRSMYEIHHMTCRSMYEAESSVDSHNDKHNITISTVFYGI